MIVKNTDQQTKVCHRSMSGNPAICLLGQCSAWKQHQEAGTRVEVRYVQTMPVYCPVGHEWRKEARVPNADDLKPSQRYTGKEPDHPQNCWSLYCIESVGECLDLTLDIYAEVVTA